MKYKQLEFIWGVSLIMGFVTLLLDIFFKFAFNPAQLFISVSFIALFFDMLISMKNEKNPFIKTHYKLMAFIELILTSLVFALGLLQGNFPIILIAFALVAIIGIVEMSLFSNIIEYAVYYELLSNYADAMRKARAMGYKLKK